MKPKLLLTLFAFLSLNMIAQQPTLLPIDPTVRIGQLDNGLTYYISHSENPKQCADFQLALPIGSILEEDHQNGIAHFVEHMAFRSTEHFPNGAIKSYCESLGLKFGEGLNAYTTQDSTWYFMSNIPTLRESTIDSVLLVLYDWSKGLKLLDNEIDIERKVITEEWANTASSQVHFDYYCKELLFPGSRYAERSTIGDTTIIQNCEYDVIRDFYKKWYTPDKQAIVVVGDVDVALIEEKIKALWSDVPKPTHPEELPVFSVTDYPEPRVLTIDVLGTTSLELIFTHDQIPPALRGTDAAYIYDLQIQMVCQMLYNRLNEMIDMPNTSIVGCNTIRGNLAGKDVIEVVSAPKSTHEQQACKELLFELEKIRRYGLTHAELDRVKKDLLAQYQFVYENRATKFNYVIAEECRSHYLLRTPLLGEDIEYQMVETLLPQMNLEVLNNTVKYLLNYANVDFLYSKNDKSMELVEEEVLGMLDEVQTMEIEAPKENTVIRKQLVEKAPKAGEIKETAYNESLGTTEWTLSNGVRVVVKSADSRDKLIIFSGVSLGGLSFVRTEDFSSAILIPPYVAESGLDDMSKIELNKILAGKNIFFTPMIDDNQEMVVGSSAVQDLETLLQCNYLFFTTQRRDENAYKRLIDAYIALGELPSQEVFKDNITLAQNDYSPRTNSNTQIRNDISSGKVNLDKIIKVCQERYANPADFVFCFVGNIDPNDVEFQKLVCTWLGGLKTTKHKERVRDNKVRAPKGKIKRDLTYGTNGIACIYIDFTSYDIPYSLENELCMQILGNILTNRLLESVREKEGGTYNIQANGSLSMPPKSLARLFIYFETALTKRDKMKQLVYKEIANMAKDGPSTTDLESEKTSLLKQYEESLLTCDNWLDYLNLYYQFGINYVKDYKTTVQNITADEIRSILKQLVSAGNNLEVVISPSTE